MTKVRCAALECKHNNDCICTLREVKLFSRHVHTSHEGLQNFLQCADFAPDDEYLEILSFLGENPKLTRKDT